MQKYFTIWWVRILAFFAIGFLLFLALSPVAFLIPEIVFFAVLLLTSIIIESFRPGGKWYTFGIMFGRWTLKDISFGFLYAMVAMIVVALIGLIAGAGFRETKLMGSEYFFHVTILVFVFASTEELMFRGVLFQALLDRFPTYPVVILTSFLFSLAHINNNHVTVIALINIFLAGILLSLMYVRTLSLWLPISFHFFWNWGQNVFLGSPISGFDFGISLITMQTNSYADFIFGGNFGIEGGLVSTAALIITILLTIKYSTVSPFIASKIFEIRYDN